VFLRLAAACAIAALAGLAQKAETEAAKPAAAPESRRTELNLLGKTDTGEGESRRNENVQFNLIDNNALKELNVRLGTSATLIQEFRADRGYFGTEYGNRPPSPIHLTGSKLNGGIHGSLFEAHTNSVFNARSFFQVGGVKPAHENQYGATIVMPVWRGAHLTVDGGGQRIRGNVNGNVLVPKADERTPLVTDPAKRALIQKLIDGFPAELPNRTDMNERALNTNSTQRINDNSLGGRIDQKLGARDSLFLRYGYTAQNVVAFQLAAGQNPDTTTRAHNASATWLRNWSAATISTASASFDRAGSVLVPEPDSPGPSVTFANIFAKLGPSSSVPIDRALNRFRYGGAVRQNRGNHNWYAGGDLVRRQVNGSEVSSHRGNLHFRNDFGRTAIQNFLLGIPTRFSGATGDVHRGFRVWESALHVGAASRLRPDLTLSYGIRYELSTRPIEVNGINALPYPCDCNNFAPRFGFAYRLPSNGGTLRGNYGVHFGEIYTVTFQQVRYNPPHTRKFEVLAPDLLLPFQQLNVPVEPGVRSAVFDISPNLKTPYSHQYNLSWERPLGNRARLQLGYVGSRAHKLFILWYTNRAVPVPGIPLITSTVNERRPDVTKFDVRRIVNGSRAYFDAGRVSLITQRWHGFSVDASYWLSKSIDWGSAYSNTGTGDDGTQSQSQTELNSREDTKGVSVFDQPHAFLMRASYTSPSLAGWLLRGWEISGVILLKTGTPFTVITGADGPGFGNVDGDNGDRPNLVDPSVLGRSIGNPDTSRALLPATAFAYIRPGEERGNLGSNTFRKGGIRNVNASLARQFPLRGDRRLELRAESVNFFNTPQFAAPWVELSSPGFGSITNTLNDGRAFRFQLKFVF